MKHYRQVFLATLLLLLLCLPALRAQSLFLLEDNLEELAEETGTADWEDELEELSYRLQEPLNLNTATREQLEQFPFLTTRQVEEIQAYIYIHGQMQTIYELQLVEEMDKRTIDLLLPFVCVKPVEEGRGFPSPRDILKFGKHEALVRFDVPFYRRKGYETDYLGPPWYHSVRYSFRRGDYPGITRCAIPFVGATMCRRALRRRRMRANLSLLCTTSRGMTTIPIMSCCKTWGG